MSSVSSTTGNPYYDALNAQTAQTTDRMNDLSMSDFIKMMVAELENQDPMDPMSNTEMLSQISQMRQITSNEKLATGIEALTIGQSLTTASSIIGKTISGVNSLGKEVTGKVDKVTIEDGKAKLYVGSSIIEIGNVSTIKDPETKAETGETGETGETDETVE